MILYLCTAIIVANRQNVLRNRDDMCHVFKTIQTSAETVDIIHAIEIAKTMKESDALSGLLRDCPGIDFLSKEKTSMSSVKHALVRVAPLVLGATVAGMSLVLATSSSDSIKSFLSSYIY